MTGCRLLLFGIIHCCWVLAAAADTTGCQQCIGSVAGTAPVVGQDALRSPISAALDKYGNLYVTSELSIKLARRDGTITQFAGSGTQGFSGDGNLATLAQLSYPSGLGADASGNLLVADTDNCVVRLVLASNNTIVTIAGNAALGAGYGGDGGPATAAQLNGPFRVATEADGSILVADYYNNLVRRVWAANQTIVTVAGNALLNSAGMGYSGDGGPATSALLYYPAGLAVSAAGDIFIADSNNFVIRKVLASNGIITTVAGNFAAGPGWSGDGGPATLAMINGPLGVAVDAAGTTIFIADFEASAVRKVLDGVISTVAGNKTLMAGYSGDGGPASIAQLQTPGDVLLDAAGNVIISDTANNIVRIVWAANGTISVLCGVPPGVTVTDGTAATSTQLASANGVAADARGNFFVADTLNCVIRYVRADTGVMSTVAGSSMSGGCGFGGDGGPATLAQLNAPEGIAVDAAGNILIADVGNSAIRMVSAVDGTISTVAGVPGQQQQGGDGGAAVLAFLYDPVSVSVDAHDNWIICDTVNSAVRLVNASSNRTITTIAGNGTGGFSGDGGPATLAQLSFPTYAAFLSGGDLLIADSNPTNLPAAFNGNCVVRRVSAVDGTIETVVGNSAAPLVGVCRYSGDGGPATLAQLSPWGIAVDSHDNVFIADDLYGVVRMVVNGTIYTVAGSPQAGIGFSGDGGPATAAQLQRPSQIAFDAFGNLLVADAGNANVRIVLLGTQVFCPVGHTCPFGSPLACTSGASFCPANSVAQVAVTGGFYSVPDVPAASPRTGLSACPIGFFCPSGVRTACAAGSIGIAPLQLTQAACRPCAAGSYSALPAQTDAAVCLPCPAGTYASVAGSSLCTPCPVNTFNGAVGAANVAACAPCANGTAALGGASACFAAAAAALITIDAAPVGTLPTSFTTLQLLQATTPDVSAQKTKAIDFSVGTAVPVAVAGMIPVLLLLASALACCRWMAEPLDSFQRFDVYSLFHFVPVGSSPVKQATKFGGTMSFAALFTLLALTSALLVQYYTDNVLVQQGTLPALLPTLVSLSAPASAAYVPVHTLDAPAAFGLQLRAGLVVYVQAAGPRCGALLSLEAKALIAGAFVPSVSVDPHTLAATHTLACEQCSLGPLSELTLTLDASCQQLLLMVAAVGAQGTITAVQLAVAGPSAVPDGSGQALAAVTVSIQPTLEVLVDDVKGTSTRGYTLSAQPPTALNATNPAAVTLQLALGTAPQYIAVQLLPVTSVAQLLSSILGLLGILGVFGRVFMYAERVEGAQCTRRCRGSRAVAVFTRSLSSRLGGKGDECGGGRGSALAGVAAARGSGASAGMGARGGGGLSAAGMAARSSGQHWGLQLTAVASSPPTQSARPSVVGLSPGRPVSDRSVTVQTNPLAMLRVATPSVSPKDEAAATLQSLPAPSETQTAALLPGSMPPDSSSRPAKEPPPSRAAEL